MGDIISRAVEELASRIDSFDGSVKVIIEGEGAMMIDGDGVRAADEEASCTMTADARTFQGLLTGDVNPASAFMAGRLSVDGDMGQAMKLGAVLS
ncbi:MAG: SCP2 sterol-binding domain-containing protein [Rhodobacteraceae bacterium]|nr:SCP2 sterol-binding domain-containing protein [Paracoccaceae bacterium]